MHFARAIHFVHHPASNMGRIVVICLLCWELGFLTCHAQQLEPRRWAHLPMDTNFGGAGYAYTGAEIEFDPALRLDDVRMQQSTFPVKYIRSFELFGKSARIDWLQAYQTAEWSGLLDGVPASTAREGWSDMSLRFAVNAIGAPPLSGKEFAEYRAKTQIETIVGLGLVVQLPTGQYKPDKLLNLGTNRYMIRPQVGVVHRRGKWSGELTGSTWVFTDNENFFNGRLLEQDPLVTAQGHLDYTFRPGLWAAGALGYGNGSQTAIDLIQNNDRRENFAWMTSVGCPFSKTVGFKVSYIGIESLVDVGSDSHSVLTSVSILW